MNMAVSQIGSAGAATTAAGTNATTAADGEQRFLKLLVTQLNNQDPLNPLDNAQLTSQLAQMSTVSGIEKLNAALQSLIAQSGAGQVLQAASLIGRDVLVAGNHLQLAAGTPANFAIEPAGVADTVAVDIVEASGRVVRHLDLGTLSQGLHQLSWDGLDENGKAVAAGTYGISVSASQGGTPVAAEALTFQRVRSVAQADGGITLEVGAGQTAALGSVRLIQ
jgi:flagellar basal-body rod modification protein FlgD